MINELAGEDGDLEDEPNAVAAEDLRDLPVTRLGGEGGRAGVKQCMMKGGVGVHFRLGGYYKCTSDVVYES